MNTLDRMNFKEKLFSFIRMPEDVHTIDSIFKEVLHEIDKALVGASTVQAWHICGTTDIVEKPLIKKEDEFFYCIESLIDKEPIDLERSRFFLSLEEAEASVRGWKASRLSTLRNQVAKLEAELG